jgi:hypothetical protein
MDSAEAGNKIINGNNFKWIPEEILHEVMNR